MKRNFITLLILLVTFIGTNEIFAANISKARFGSLGIQHYATIEKYREVYIGQTVKYIQGITESGKRYDRNFVKIGGKYDTEYIIEKITGDNDNMIFVLVEKNGKHKIKLPVRNYDPLYSSVGKYFYSISEDYSLPLLLIDKFNQAQLEYKGKKYAIYEVIDLIIGTDESQYKYEYTKPDYPSIYLCLNNTETNKSIYCDINGIQEFEKASQYIGKNYPSPEAPIHYKVTDFSLTKFTNGYYTLLTLKNPEKPEDFAIYQPKYLNDFNDLGKEFTNPVFKCKYTVVGVKRESKYNYFNYIVENSINKKRKTIPTNNAEIAAFAGDLDGKFLATLKKVEKPSNSAIRYGKTTSITDKDITKYGYVDNYIDILIFANTSQFVFDIKNVSSNTIKIVWDEAVFVDVDGSTSKIMHTGVKYSEREGAQPASTIIKNAKLEDIATPTSNVYYNESLKKWDSHSLYRNADQTKKGQTIRLMLPIQVKDIINEYIFEFEIDYNYLYPELLNI